MSGEAAGGPSLATLLSSTWLCDDAGDVYVLKNLDRYVDSYVANIQYKLFLTRTAESLTLTHYATPPPTPAPDWIKVGSNFRSVAAGFEGIVCGLNMKSELYIRLGVTARLPEGTAWAKIVCGAVQIAVGKDCIARKDGSGRLFVANVRKEYDLSRSKLDSLVLNHWKAISLNSLEDVVDSSCDSVPVKFEHMLLDHEDRLFIVTQSGTVYGCLTPCSEDGAGWVKVSRAPPISSKPGFLRNLYSYIVVQEKRDVFSQVCAGKGSLWCVAAEKCELWHLVISTYYSSKDVSKLRTNWTSVQIPTQEERAVHVAASKSTVDGIYTVMVKNSNGQRIMVAFSLNQSDKGRVEIDLPSQHEPKSLVISLNSVAPPSLYPRLPHTDTDICCEEGDCEHCRNVQELHIPTVVYPHLYPYIPQTEEGEGASVRMLRKRSHPEACLPENTSCAIGSNNGYLEHRSVKRRRVEHPDHVRGYLLDGVQVQPNPLLDYYLNLLEPSNSIFQNPLPKESIAAQYEYSFALEQEVITSSTNY